MTIEDLLGPILSFDSGSIAEMSDAELNGAHARAEPDFQRVRRKIESAEFQDHGRMLEQLRSARGRTSEPTLGAFLLTSLMIRTVMYARENWIPIGADSRLATPRLIDQLQAICEEAPSSDPHVRICESLSLLLMGRTNEALQGFDSTNDDEWYWKVVRHDFMGANTCRELPDLGDILQRGAGPLLSGTKEITSAVKENAAITLSYSCDDRYFRAFAPGILDSVRGDASKIAFHFHVVGMTAEGLSLVEHLEAQAMGKIAGLHVTSERVWQGDRAYYACVRFLRANEWMNRFRTPLFLLDTDTIFMPDDFSWLGDFDQSKIQFLRSRAPWGSGYLPWRMIWAGQIFIPLNLSGRIFAKTLGGSLSYLWEKERRRNWWIDQTGLYVAMKLLQPHWTVGGFGDLPASARLAVHTGLEFKTAMLARSDTVLSLVRSGTPWAEALSTANAAD